MGQKGWERMGREGKGQESEREGKQTMVNGKESTVDNTVTDSNSASE